MDELGAILNSPLVTKLIPLSVEFAGGTVIVSTTVGGDVSG